MLRPRSIRLLLALAVGLATGAAVLVRAAPFEPHVEIQVVILTQREEGETYRLRLRARGGETLDEVRIEPVLGLVQIRNPRVIDLAPGTDYTTQAHVTFPGLPGRVRVIQEGRVHREVEVDLAEWARR